ncbi:MAG: hypothetical protein AABO58_05355 [Acidobacteriota bacterium]
MLRLAVLLCLSIALAASAAGPEIAITRFPQGIMQPVGSPAESDDFVLANVGTDPASVTVSRSSTFFTVSPSQFVLEPGASRTVIIQPAVQQGGLYDGTITILVGGKQRTLSLPVRLFIGSRPSGTVTPRASQNQVIVAPVAGAQHAGNANVTNFGNVTMQGILTADVPWIVPSQNNVIGIAPNNTAQMPFVIDSEARPDGQAPLGATLGTLSMIYLRGTSGSEIGPLQTGSVNVTVIDISKVAVVPQQPAALAAGEAAAFLPAITDLGGFFTDVFLSNRGASSLSNVRLFYNAAGAAPASSLLANIGLLPAGGSAWFPFAPSSVFNVGNQTGGLQVRGTAVGNVSVSAIRGIIPDGTNRYLTAMPTLASDRSVASGERLLFAGVEKSAAAHTDVVIQEASGVAGAYTIDFFDAAGAPVAPNRTGSILPFGSLSLADTVPAGARSARLTNSSSGAARLSGFATVIDESTRDNWTVVDASRIPAPAADLLVLIPALAGTPPSIFDVWLTNASASSVSVTVATRLQPPHRRAVNVVPPAPVTLAAGETRKITITSAPQGYVRITGPAGAISATGRLTSTVTGRAGAFGTGVPALTAGTASGTGTVKRFSRAADVPNVSPATLLLLEAARKPATVRVTVRFTFPAGSTIAGSVSASKDYALASGQLLSVPDIVRAILGPARDTLGIIFNLLVDVEVVSGEGRVLSFLQTIDGSGDLTLSSD